MHHLEQATLKICVTIGSCFLLSKLSPTPCFQLYVQLLCEVAYLILGYFVAKTAVQCLLNPKERIQCLGWKLNSKQLMISSRRFVCSAKNYFLNHRVYWILIAKSWKAVILLQMLMNVRFSTSMYQNNRHSFFNHQFSSLAQLTKKKKTVYFL